jgi:hypothetical protein
MCTWLSELSPHLFWDVDRETVDPDRHARWVLERVLQRGRWEDWLIARGKYPKETMRALASRLHVDRKAAAFLSLYCRDD